MIYNLLYYLTNDKTLDDANLYGGSMYNLQ